MSKSKPQDSNSNGKNQTRIALISAATTLVAALITGVFGLIQSNLAKRAQPSPAPVIAPLQVLQTATRTMITPLSSAAPLSSTTSDVSQPTVEIDGPATVPLGKKSYFMIISTQGQRAEWSIGGFADNKNFVIEPLTRSHQIFIEPTDATRIGDNFTLIVTVFGSEGHSATAKHQLRIVESE